LGVLTVLLRRHNLNLLPILRELLRTRSVGRTAEIVGLSQSAVSAALARLRETYNDDLLVMVGRRLELTEKGAQLIEQTERACLEMETLLRPPAFDPSTESRRFVVATADYVAFLLAPALAQLVAQEAPGASVHFIDVPTDMLPQLVRGTIDAVAIPDDTAKELDGQTSSALLFMDDMVVIASSKQRTTKGELTKEIYEASRHARFKMSPTSMSHQDFSLRRAGIRQHDLIVVQQFLSLPSIVEASECLALVYRRLAERFVPSHDIEILSPPFDIPPIAVTAYWGRSVERDPAHAWFRRLLMRVGAGLHAAECQSAAHLQPAGEQGVDPKGADAASVAGPRPRPTASAPS
jgi:DNA-binding transcriptional LysR family regulator